MRGRPGWSYRIRWSRYRLIEDNKPRTKFYTYGAQVLSIIDGDTMWVEINCGFGVVDRREAAATALAEGRYLNRELIEEGLATPMG